MDVDGSPRGHIQHHAGQDLAERHDHGNLRRVSPESIRPLRIAQPRRLHDGNSCGECALLDRRGGEPLAAMRGAVGLGDDRDHTVMAEQNFQGGDREGGGSVEEDAHAD